MCHNPDREFVGRQGAPLGLLCIGAMLAGLIGLKRLQSNPGSIFVDRQARRRRWP